jgi:hypothetical protein
MQLRVDGARPRYGRRRHLLRAQLALLDELGEGDRVVLAQRIVAERMHLHSGRV